MMAKDLKHIELLPSRRNKVYKVKLNIPGENKFGILKIFQGTRGAITMKNECDIISMLTEKGISVPKIIETADNYILYEYISGILVSHLAETLNLGKWIEDLALWYVKLHEIKNPKGSFLKGDANLRNFIYFKNQIYGLDFEEWSFGDVREDLAEICFFLLTDNPKLTREKDIMVRRFLTAYERYSGSKIVDISKFILKSMERARIRRKKHRGSLKGV